MAAVLNTFRRFSSCQIEANVSPHARACIAPRSPAQTKLGSPDGVIPPGASVDFTIELTSIDSDSGIIGAVGGTFAMLAALIAANGVALQLTGHELREYLAGTV